MKRVFSSFQDAAKFSRSLVMDGIHDNLSRYCVLATKWIMMEIPLSIEKAEDSGSLRTAWNGDRLRLLCEFV
ncbi:MAG TPA: hypothetical protein DCL66_06760 [Gammaproteobacteria bacterium]|nr:hypothetical protein [Gammaproteobacteria bacterium]